jgi:low affinity Fe/Cu permease
MKLNDWFARFAARSSVIAGSAWTFVIVFVLTIIWLATGPYFNFSTGWNFAANSSTTVLTTILIVLVQNTQNRDNKAIHLKLDELIRAKGSADNRLMCIEMENDEELDALRAAYEKIKGEGGKPPL